MPRATAFVLVALLAIPVLHDPDGDQTSITLRRG